jgi:hypothetical protein
MVFKEIIAVYSENHMKLTNTLRGQNLVSIIKAAVTHN